MHVNTSVVKALMNLRDVTEPSMASMVHVTLKDLQSWLHSAEDDGEEKVPFETQLEILNLLGVRGEAPRADVVHYWKLHESLFSSASSTYGSLQILLKAFGRAQAVFISREADPGFRFEARAHFGLKFANFMAILEVSAHPLRSISFDPEILPDVSWVPDSMGVLLPETEYDGLEPGSMKVNGLTRYLTYTSEIAKWEKLRENALEQGIRADQVAALLLGNSVSVARVTNEQRPAETATAVKEEKTVNPNSMQGSVPVSALVPASAVTAAQADSRNDEMLLFSKPVKGAERSPLKRVS